MTILRTAKTESLLMTLGGLVVALCVLLRMILYCHNYTLWFDEAMLAVNLRDASWAQLFGPLPYYDQCSPVLYLLLGKLSLSTLGDSSLAARLIPLLCGIGCVVLILSVRQISRFERLLVAACIAVSADCLRYSVEAKQYGPEVFFSLGFYLACRRLSAEVSRSTITWYLVTGVACALGVTGFPILYAASAAAIIFALRAQSLKRVMPWCIGLGVCYGIYYLLVIRGNISFQTTNYFTYSVGWNYPLDLSALAHTHHWKDSLFQFLSGLRILLTRDISLDGDSPAGKWIFRLLLVVIAICAIRRNMWTFTSVAIGATIVVIAALNMLHLAPLGPHRFYLFMIPWTLFFLASFIHQLSRGWRTKLLLSLPFLLLLPGTVAQMKSPFRQDSRQTLSYIQSVWGRIPIFVNVGAEPIIDFYFDPFRHSCYRDDLAELGLLNRCTGRILPFPRSDAEFKDAMRTPGIWADGSWIIAEYYRNSGGDFRSLDSSGFAHVYMNFMISDFREHDETLLVIDQIPQEYAGDIASVTSREFSVEQITNERVAPGNETGGELLLIKRR